MGQMFLTFLFIGIAHRQSISPSYFMQAQGHRGLLSDDWRRELQTRNEV